MNNREVDLLLAIASWEMTPARADRVRAAAVKVDWERWLMLVEAHRLVPHALRQLTGAGVRAPEGVGRELATRANAGQVHGLALLRQRDAVAHTLAAGGVRALPFKGPSLAIAAYGDSGARPSVDLDFVVEPSNLARALEALRGAGYDSRYRMTPAQERALQTSFGHIEYERAGEPAKVEMHTMFSSPRYPWTLPVAEVLERATWSSDGRAEAMDPADDVLLQAAHATRHHWAPLEWLVAFAATLRRRAPDPARLMDLAERHRSARALRVSLRLVQDMLGETIPPALSAWTTRDARVSELAAEVADALSPGDPERWIGSPTRFDLRLLDGTGDRLRYLAHSLVDPTMREWELVKLPDSLLALYYPIRLARLALKPFVRR